MLVNHALLKIIETLDFQGLFIKLERNLVQYFIHMCIIEKQSSKAMFKKHLVNN